MMRTFDISLMFLSIALICVLMRMQRLLRSCHQHLSSLVVAAFALAHMNVTAASFLLNVDDFKDSETVPLSIALPLLHILRLNEQGVVRSSNPVWNVCVSGKPIRKGLIQRNTDTFEYRRGHLHAQIPFTCRDYRRGDPNVWKHPDFPDLDLFLDKKGRLVGGVPNSYITVRE